MENVVKEWRRRGWSLPSGGQVQTYAEQDDAARPRFLALWLDGISRRFCVMRGGGTVGGASLCEMMIGNFPWRRGVGVSEVVAPHHPYVAIPLCPGLFVDL